MFKGVNDIIPEVNKHPKMFKDSQELIAKYKAEEVNIPIIKALHANVILFSYNRPRMLREAILSVLGQTYTNFTLWVFDDGSTNFDPEKLIKEFNSPKIVGCFAPQINPEERVNPDSSRWEDNINYILDQIPRDNNFVVYLCDDDVFDPDWLNVVNYMLFTNDSYHTINGMSMYFWDGQNPYKEGKKGFLGNITEKDADVDWLVWWNVGSFGHRMSCVDEGVRWGPSRGGHSWDIEYVKKIWQHAASYLQIDAPSIYRREHDNAMSHKIGRFSDGKYSEAPVKLTVEHVTSPME